MLVCSIVAAICLALVHLFAGRLKIMGKIPRSRWLSFAGGVSVAYVFVHLFPEFSEHQQIISEAAGDSALLKHHVYLIALAGLTLFYGLERLAKTSKKRNDGDRSEEEVFWIHISSFAVYNSLIGYLLLHRKGEVQDLILFSLAMALHFLVNDEGLVEHHKSRYQKHGRWILASAVLMGWTVGWQASLDEIWIALLFSFLAGGVILNVLKEELPEERKSCFRSFVLGVSIYTGVLMLI